MAGTHWPGGRGVACASSAGEKAAAGRPPACRGVGRGPALTHAHSLTAPTRHGRGPHGPGRRHSLALGTSARQAATWPALQCRRPSGEALAAVSRPSPSQSRRERWLSAVHPPAAGLRRRTPSGNDLRKPEMAKPAAPSTWVFLVVKDRGPLLCDVIVAPTRRTVGHGAGQPRIPRRRRTRFLPNVAADRKLRGWGPATPVRLRTRRSAAFPGEQRRVTLTVWPSSAPDAVRGLLHRLPEWLACPSRDASSSPHSSSCPCVCPTRAGDGNGDAPRHEAAPRCRLSVPKLVFCPYEP